KNSIYWLKKDAFGMYKSAEEHTKLKGSLSSWIWVMPLAIGFVAYNAYKLNNSYQARLQPQQAQEAQSEAGQGQTQGQQPNAPQNATGGVYGQQQQMQQMPAQDPNRPLSASDYIPSIDGQPWTAPIYNGHNRNIQTMPYPAACVKSGSKCTCYTDQATTLEIDKAQCLKYVEDGIYNPYLADEYQNQTPAPRAYGRQEAAQSSPQVSSLGGRVLPSLSEGNDSDLDVIQ
ncbi:zonular occludens toxin family protein, partial [Kingella sp. SNUBH-2017]|nr:zonular occludens toxin family protein [Kingella sp. SNUBH-2017]